MALVRDVSSPETRVAADKPIHWANFTTISCVAILVGTELVGMSWAAGWALGGLFRLPPAGGPRRRGRVRLSASWRLFYFMRAAIKVEPIRG